MYSRCSHCQALQTISAEKLRSGRGLLICSNCGKPYDALLSLSDHAETEIALENTADFVPGGLEKSAETGIWWLGSFLSVGVLIAQICYFEGDAIIRQPDLRAGLSAVCDLIKCQLPTYKNLDEWSVSESDLRSLSAGKYVFSAIITNQAAFSQACPDLKLVLQNFNGQAVAERIFSAQQYSAVSSLASNESAGISLTIVAPSEAARIGGYSFALL